MDTWSIIYYETPGGEKPVFESIEKLELKTQTKIYNSVELLREFGLQLHAPHAKKLLDTDLWELRILGIQSMRILYIAISSKTFLFLHVFKKKTQKTPTKEIKTAQNRLAEYLARQKQN